METIRFKGGGAGVLERSGRPDSDGRRHPRQELHGPAPVGATAPRVAIAVATYRRTHLLAPLLDALAEQVADYGPAEVLLVDNNPEPVAAALASMYRSRSIRYVHEPRPGIAAARNRALSECRDYAAIAFIDDDELPSRGWLTSLVSLWQEWGCAAVTGPVVSTFADVPNVWARESGVFARRLASTGSIRRGAASNNLLLDMQWLNESGLRFDERFGLTGGSDTMLTHAMVAQGAVIRWCDEAEVTEEVPPDRATRRWILRRTMRTSNDWSRVRLVLAGRGFAGLRERLDLSARGAFRLLRGVGRAAAGTIAGRPGLHVSGMCDVASGYGMVGGALGHVRTEYGRDSRQ